MDKILDADGYGICLFSLEILQDFLKRKRVRAKKLLDKFQKNKELYLDMLKEGIWVPFVPINAVDYVIKLEGYDAPFNEEWEKKLEYGIKHYYNANERSYDTLSQKRIYTDHKNIRYLLVNIFCL